MEDIKIIVNPTHKHLTIIVGDRSVAIDQHVIGAFNDALKEVISPGGEHYGHGCFLGLEREREMTRMDIQYYYEWNALNNLSNKKPWGCPVCRSYCDTDVCGNCGVDETDLIAMVDEMESIDVDLQFLFDED